MLSAVHIPNLLTGLRLLLVPPLIVLLVQGEYTGALILFLLAGLSDGADGFLARRYGWTTRLGSILDPLADKLLHVSVYVTLGFLGYLPHWLVALVIGRDVLIVAGGLAYHVLVGRYVIDPHWLSKLNTLAQMLLVLAVIVSLGAVALPSWLLEGLVYIVIGTTLASGLEYVWVWSGKALAHTRAARARR